MDNPTTEMDEPRKAEKESTPHLILYDSFPQSPINSHSTSPSSSPPLHSLTLTNKDSISNSYSPPPNITHGSPSLDHNTLDLPSNKPVITTSLPQDPIAVTKFDIPNEGGGNGKVEERSGGDGGVGGSGRRFRPGLSILKRTRREKMVKWAGLGFRVFGAICCLISFSVMAANKNKGWAIDSFYNYKEFKYSLSINVIGFIYSAGQAFDSSYYLVTGKYALQHPYRYYFDFAVDQIVTYLLISASSSATTRIDDWQLNWGRDKFPDMATASVAISFLAFVAIAFSSLISGYTLCTSKLLQF